MRVPFLRPPPPTLVERLFGRRRARSVRRRLAFAAMGLGFTLLRPRPRRWAVASLAVVVGVTLVLVPVR